MSELISVVIPTYHNRGHLSEAVKSALQQESVDLEVIVVDDNNPNSLWRENTESEMSMFSCDKRVKYICHSSNKNGAAARNTGIKASSGQYIAFLDDDDKFLDGKLIRQLQYLQAHPEYNAVYGQILRSGKIVQKDLSQGDLSKDLLLLKTSLQTSTLMFRAEALKEINGFDESFYRHQDYEMMLRFFKAGNKIGALQIPVSEFGRNAGENIPKGDKLENIKRHFLKTFDEYINEYNLESPGYKNDVYAAHYGQVFLSHLKNGHLIKAFMIMMNYSLKSPRYFWSPIKRSIILHLKGQA